MSPWVAFFGGLAVGGGLVAVSVVAAVVQAARRRGW